MLSPKQAPHSAIGEATAHNSLYEASSIAVKTAPPIATMVHLVRVLQKPFGHSSLIHPYRTPAKTQAVDDEDQ